MDQSAHLSEERSLAAESKCYRGRSGREKATNQLQRHSRSAFLGAVLKGPSDANAWRSPECAVLGCWICSVSSRLGFERKPKCKLPPRQSGHPDTESMRRATFDSLLLLQLNSPRHDAEGFSPEHRRRHGRRRGCGHASARSAALRTHRSSEGGSGRRLATRIFNYGRLAHLLHGGSD